MTDPDAPGDDLENRVRAEIQEGEGVEAIDIRESDAGWLFVTLEQEGTVETYLVALEHRPDGPDELHWTYLGPGREE